MTDINRRGFLQLLGATGAVALIPSTVLAAVEAPPQSARVFSGLWVRTAGRVMKLGDIVQTTLVQARDTTHHVQFGQMVTIPRPWKPPEMTCTLVTTPEGCRNVVTLGDLAASKDPYCDLIAVHHVTDQQTSSCTNDNLYVRLGAGDLIVASRRALFVGYEAMQLVCDTTATFAATFQLGSLETASCGSMIHDSKVITHYTTNNTLIPELLQLEQMR